MNANDILQRYKDKGDARASLEVCLRLNEEIQDVNRTLKACAESIDTLTRVVAMTNAALDGMDSMMDTLKKNKLNPEDDDGSSTRGLIG